MEYVFQGLAETLQLYDLSHCKVTPILLGKSLIRPDDKMFFHGKWPV